MTTTLALNDGRSIPQLGFGVWQVPNDNAVRAVDEAVRAGYRLIDTAAIYGNEDGVGDAIAQAPVPREELFITTKLWNDRQGYDSTLRAFDESMARLRLDVLDLYLIHWPVAQRASYLETWRAFARLRDEGRIRSIGVSNFTIPLLQHLREESGVVPVVNQVELHPRFQQEALRRFHQEQGIVTQSWSPLGQGTVLQEPVLAALAKKHGKSPAQIVIRWHLDNGLVAIPKSVTPARIRENFDVFDFELAPEDLAAIGKLDDPRGRIGPDPDRLN